MSFGRYGRAPRSFDFICPDEDAAKCFVLALSRLCTNAAPRPDSSVTCLSMLGDAAEGWQSSWRIAEVEKCIRMELGLTQVTSPVFAVRAARGPCHRLTCSSALVVATARRTHGMSVGGGVGSPSRRLELALWTPLVTNPPSHAERVRTSVRLATDICLVLAAALPWRTVPGMDWTRPEAQAGARLP